MLYGLKLHIVEKTKTVFAKYPQIEKVILYGSRAKGTYKSGSDIDMTIVGKNIDLSILHKIENEIDDLMLPHTFDLSVFSQIKNEDLLDHIKRVGIEFYVRHEG